MVRGMESEQGVRSWCGCECATKVWHQVGVIIDDFVLYHSSSSSSTVQSESDPASSSEGHSSQRPYAGSPYSRSYRLPHRRHSVQTPLPHVAWKLWMARFNSSNSTSDSSRGTAASSPVPGTVSRRGWSPSPRRTSSTDPVLSGCSAALLDGVDMAHLELMT